MRIRHAAVAIPVVNRSARILAALPVLFGVLGIGDASAAGAACPSGLVWRERFDGDTICVLPGERDANRHRRGLPASAPPSACPSGLVWRERFDGDTVCVTPLERDANRQRRGLPVNK
jgi:hypothetical protein